MNDLAALCRRYVPEAVEALAGIALDSTDEAARVTATRELFARFQQGGEAAELIRETLRRRRDGHHEQP
jgi:hypothetical protein